VDWFAMTQNIFSNNRLASFRNTRWLVIIFIKEKLSKKREGTLASTLPVSLNALSKEGVHVVTVNDYAERDQNGWERSIKA
jgi:hypothetical protein